jgi:hypothetical protein
MKIKYVFFSILLIRAFHLYPQEIYYGQNDFGKIKILNDSALIVYFIGHLMAPEWGDTCFYKRYGDTIKMSTHIKSRFIVTIDDTVLHLKSDECEPIVLKQFEKQPTKKGYEYQLLSECGAMSCYPEGIILSEFRIRNGMIIVIKDCIEYVRLKWIYGDITTKSAMIKTSVSANHLVFDKFPLLLKSDKLIPTDKKAIEQCWIDNGFYFPKMKKSKRIKRYKTVSYWLIGLTGLPHGFSFDNGIDYFLLP